MCGIAGIISLDQTPISDLEKLLMRMNQRQKHRGPDGQGFWVNQKKTVGFGHRRLAIVDLSSSGKQPMSNEDGTVWITFNGEIYNHLSLREELEKSGHTYHSQTDTETVIHAYEEWGEKCLQKFRGMFAFALYDLKKNQLFFVRDRIGIKPFYYTIFNNKFFFASEIKAILSNREIPRKMDEEAFYHYLTFFISPAPKTLFKDIFKLSPGHYGILRNGRFRIKEYWDALKPLDNQKSEKEWREDILLTLKESVKLRMMSDVPFGAYLSGGVDSSAIAVLMNNLMDRPIDTFSIGFKKDLEFNELRYAKQISRQYKTNYHDVLVDKKDLVNFFDLLIFHQDEPIADWVCFPLYYVSKLIRKNKVIVAQVGEGSDELFCGYDGYMQFLWFEKFFRFFKIFPKFLRFIFYKLAILAYYFRPIALLPEVFRRIYRDEELFWGGAIAFTEFEKKKLLTTKIKNSYNSHDVVKKIYSKFDKKFPGRDFLDRLTYLELKNRLAELLLMRVDKISMAVSIEARVPFLDHIFVEKMLAIPRSIKISQGPKAILKRSLGGILPQNIIYRKKKGFGAPISKWLKEPKFGEFLMGKILSSRLLKKGFLNIAYIKEMYRRHCQGKGDFSVQLWILANLCGWYDYWIAK